MDSEAQTNSAFKGNHIMNIKDLEQTYTQTMEELDKLSLDKLRELVQWKRNILIDIEYELAVQKSNGNLDKAIEAHNNLKNYWIEDFQHPFCNELLKRKPQKEFQEDWLEILLWTYVSDDTKFDEQDLIELISVLDSYKDYLLVNQIKNEDCVK